MEIIKIIFYALAALFVLVTFHEYGHYWVARKCGVRVERFSIGFGKPFLRWKRGDTEFVLAGIPLGGYVKMYGETSSGEQIPASEQRHSFSHKTVWQRMAIVVAGPAANFLLAIFFYFVVFLGGTQGVAAIVGSVEKGSVAESAGLGVNYEIVSVDSSSVTSWADVFEQLVKRMGETGEISLGVIGQGNLNEELVSLPIRDWLGDTDQPDFLGSLGITAYTPEFEPLIGQVVDGSAAERAGMKVGDLILETDGERINDWQQWRDIVRTSAQQPLSVVVKRNEQIVDLTLIPSLADEDGEPTGENEKSADDDVKPVGRAGVAPVAPAWPEELLRDKKYSLFEAGAAAVSKTASSGLFILDSLKKLITGKVSTKSLGGPVTIAKIAGASADAGWQAFFAFLAIMSVMLGVMNLLPIPVLDGGHLLFYIIEAVKGSPLNEAVQGVAMRVGMSFVFGIMLLALYNDFTRL